MSLCLIADTFLDITQTGQGGILRVGYLDVPVLGINGDYIDSDPYDVPINPDGTFSVSFLWSAQTDPTTARVYLQFPDGKAWGGLVPSVTGPLTVEQLKTTYGWGVVSESTIPVLTVQGIQGIQGIPGTDSSVGVNSYSVSRYVDLPTAITALGSNPARLIIDHDIAPSAAVTIPSNITTEYAGGRILPTGNAVVTITGPVTAAKTVQIFGAAPGLKHYWGAWSSTRAYAVGDYVLSGGLYYQALIAHTNQAVTNATYWLPIPMVVLSGSKVATDIYPEWWGAVAASAVTSAQATINVTALHAARDQAKNLGPVTLWINGTVIVNSTVDFSFLSSVPFTIAGRGGLAAGGIRYVNTAPTYALFTLQDSNSAIINNITFDGGVNSGNLVNAAAYGVLCSRNPVTIAAAGKHLFSNCTFTNCTISGHKNYGSEDNLYLKPQFTRSPIGAVFTAYELDETQDVNGVYNITKSNYQPCPNYNNLHITNPSGVDQIETITITGAPTGGTWTLTKVNYTTRPLAFNAPASAVQAALQALPSVRGTNTNPNLSVTGADGGPYTLTWINSCGQRNITALTPHAGNLTGGTSPNITVVVTRAGVQGPGAYMFCSNISIIDGAFGSPTLPVASSRCGLMINNAQLFLTAGVVQATPTLAEASIIIDGSYLAVGLKDVTFDGGNVPALGVQVGGYAPADTNNPNIIAASGGSWSLRSVTGAEFIQAWDLVGSNFFAIHGAGPLGASVNLNGWCVGNTFDNFTVDNVGDTVEVVESGPSNTGNTVFDKHGRTYLSGTASSEAVVTPNISGGVITSIDVNYSGIGYTVVPTVVITDQNGNTTNATATCTLLGSGIGTITVTSGGTGITSATVGFTNAHPPPLLLAATGVAGDFTVLGNVRGTTMSTSGSVVIGSLTPQASDQFQSTKTWNDDLSIYRAGEFDAAKSVAGVNGLSGVEAYAILSAAATTGTQTGALTGLTGRAENLGLAAASSLRGLRTAIQASGGGAVTAAYGVYADQATVSNGSVISNAYAFFNPSQVTAGVTTAWGLYSLGGENHIRTGADSIKGITVRRHSATQSANLLEIQDEGGSIVLASVGPTGAFTASTIDATKLTGLVPVASLPVATSSVLGVVRPDTTTITQVSGVLSAVHNGTVTSVALTIPGELYSISGSPITTSGTLALAKLTTIAQNAVAAGPISGGPGTWSMRALDPADIPGLPASKITSGTFSAAQIASVNPSTLTGTGTIPIGGIPTGTTSSTVALGNDSRITGAIQSSLVTTAGDLLVATGNAAVARLAAGTSSQVLIGGAAPAFGAVPLAALSGITTTQLSATAGLVAGQIASINPSVLTGTGTVPIAGLPLATLTAKGIVLLRWLNIVDFGAAQDGSDTMLAITAAQAALPATGGKITMPAGTWTIQPTTTHEVVLRAGVTLEGEGAATILQVKSNQGDWKRLFTSSTADNITLRDFKVDYNIAANVSSTVATGGSATQNAVEILGGKNIRLDNLTFDCAGVNTVTINGATVDDVTVENCRFNFAQRTGNADYDNTCLYIHGKSYSIHKNHFTASIAPGTGAKTAFEAHGGPASVQGNTGYGFRDAGHLVATTESHGDISCIGNAFSLVANGIDIWSSSFTARSIVVADNITDLAQVTHNQASTRGIAIMADSSNTTAAQVVILSNNAVTHQVEDGTRTTAYANNTAGQPRVGSETYGIGVHVTGGVVGVILSDNIVDGAPGRGMVLGSQSGTGTFSNVKMADCILTNPGSDTALGTGYRTAVELGNNGVTLQDVLVTDLQISDATGTLQKYFDTDPLGTYVRVEVHSNKLSSANGAITSSLNLAGISTTIPIADLPTGTTSTTVPLGNDARFSDARTPLAHETSHLPIGSDALPWLTIHGAGPDASQPVSDATNAGYLYFNTDTQRLMRSDGAGSWDIIALAGLILGTDIATNANIPRTKLGNLNIGDADITSVSLAKVAGSGATAGQVPIWTGTQWVPGSVTTNVSYAAAVNADSPYLYYQLTEVPSGTNSYVAGITDGVGLTLSGKTYSFSPSALTRTWTGLHLAHPLNTSGETFGDYTAGNVASVNQNGTGWHEAYLAWPRDPANAPTLATTSHRSIDGTMFDPLNSSNGNQNPITITSVSCVGTLATFTTVHAHLISANSVVTVAGVSVAGYNGTWGVVSIPSITTFTVTLPSTLGAGSGGTVGLKYGGNVDWWIVNHPDWLLYTSTSTGFGTDNIPDPFGYKNVLSTGGRIATLDMTNPSLRAWLAANWWPAILGTGKYAGLYWDNALSVNYSAVKYTLRSGVAYKDAVPSDYIAKTGWLGASKDTQYATDMKAAWQSVYTDVKTAYPFATMTNNDGLEGDSSVAVSDWLNDYESTWDLLHTEPGFTHNGSQFLTGSTTYPLAWNSLPFFTDTSTTQSTHHFLDIAGKYRDMQKGGKGLVFFQKIPGTGTIATALSTHASTNIPVNWTAEALGGSITTAVLSNRKRWMEWALSTYFMVKYHHTYFWMNERDQYSQLMPNQAEYATAQALGQPLGDFYAVPSTAFTTSGAVTTPNAIYARDYTGGMVIAVADPAALVSATTTAQYVVDLTKVGPTPGSYKDLWSTVQGSTLTLSVPGNNPSGTWLQFAAVLLTNSSPTLTLPAAPVDSSSNARTGGVYAGDLTWGASGLFATNLGVAFPGQTTAYVKTPSMTLPAGDGSFSIECIVNPTDYLQPLQTVHNIVTNGAAALRYHPASGASHQSTFSFTMGSDANALYSSGTHAAGVYTGGYGVVTGPWYHIIFTFNGTTGVSTLYVNGTSEGTHTGTFGGTAVTWPTGVAYIGSNAAGITNMGPLIGTVDDVAFYSSALSSARVTAHYNATR